MFLLLEKAFDNMIGNLDVEYKRISNITAAENSETDINEYRNKLKDEHLLNMENNLYGYQTGVFYMDLITECERVGDYIINVSESIVEIQ